METTLNKIQALFAITTQGVGWLFVITAMVLFVKHGFIVGGAFFMIFGFCLVVTSILWLIIQQKKEVKNNVRNKQK